MNDKDFMLLNQINTITEKLELFSLAFGLDFVYSRPGCEDERCPEPNPNDSAYRVLKPELGEMLNKTLKSLDYMKKCIESKGYNKTLYIDVIKRVYLFIKAEDVLGPDFQDIHKELVEGMCKLSKIFDGEDTDILRKLLDYLEKANLPIQYLPWEYQALVNSIIGTVDADHRLGLEYLIMNLDEILIECGLCEDIPNIGEPVEEEKE